MKEFSEIITRERKKKNLSTRKLAEKSGFTEAAIRHWEAGRRSPSIEHANKLLSVLGVSIVIGHIEKMENKKYEKNNIKNRNDTGSESDQPILQQEVFLLISNEEEKYLTLCPLDKEEMAIKLTKKTAQVLIKLLTRQIQEW